MLEKIKILLIISSLVLFGGCTTIKAKGINNPPTKNFVKIIHTINIVSCSDPKDKKCPIGERFSSGSGMAIFLLPNITTVITAGHVCDVNPTEKIKNFSQTVEVLDSENKIHQAYPILISHNNQKGSIDACLLYVPSLDLKGSKANFKNPKIGEELYYIGAPMGIYHPPNPLIFKGIFSGDINPSTSQITAPATGGASGSAVLNMDNEVVGVIWGTKLHFNNASVMTNPKAFRLFLKNGKNKLKSFLTKNN